MEIYKNIVVLRKLPLTIESTFAYGELLIVYDISHCLHSQSIDDYILVGTKEGHLLMYKLDIKAKTPSGKGIISWCIAL